MENIENISTYDEEELQTNAKIIVIGVGGGGGNAVNSMISDKNPEVVYWVFNTDSQALANSCCDNKYILGRNITKGLGAGGKPEMGKIAAEDSYEDIQRIVKGADMVFIAAGEGGGTGTGAAPVVAKAAKEAGCLVLGIVTRPFTFEGKNRRTNASEGIEALRKEVDALIVVSNDKMMFNNGSMAVIDAFAQSDAILASSVKTVTDLILVHGIINLDFADVKTTLENKGISLIGIGEASGEDKAKKAANNAINSPLLESSILGAKTMLINITIGDDTSLAEIDDAIGEITQAANINGNDVNIIFGTQKDDSYHNKMKIAIIATDFDKEIDFTKPYENPNRSRAKLNTDIKTQAVIEEKKEESVSSDENKTESALPDYLKNFFTSKEEKKKVVEPKIESVQSNSETNITVEESKKFNSTDTEDDDDVIVIERKA